MIIKFEFDFYLLDNILENLCRRWIFFFFRCFVVVDDCYVFDCGVCFGDIKYEMCYVGYVL